MLREFEGIVLRSRAYGESHKIVTVFTPQLGKMALLAKGAKKPKSRLAASTEGLTRSMFAVFYRGGGLETLNRADLLEAYPTLKADLLLYAYALYILELVERICEERVPIPGLYPDLVYTLSYLAEGREASVLKVLFGLKMMGVAGYAPELSRCVRCGEGGEPLRLLPDDGGGICPRCARIEKEPAHWPEFSPACWQLLHRLQQIPLAQLGEIRIRQALLQEMDRWFSTYATHLLGKPLNSQEFLQQIRGW